jgi:hypothetical protein
MARRYFMPLPPAGAGVVWLLRLRLSVGAVAAKSCSMNRLNAESCLPRSHLITPPRGGDDLTD